MGNQVVLDEKRSIMLVRDALHRVISKLRQGKTTTPSELTIWFEKAGPKVSSLFLWMVCTVVAEKYGKAGRHNVAAWLQHLGQIVEQLALAGDLTSWNARQQRHDAAGILQCWFTGRKRIAPHQTRWRCVDRDLLLCAGAGFSLALGITPWVCQQADLRYRWTDEGFRRLAWLADCWNEYAKHELTWEHRTIGLADFPASTDYC